MMDKRENATEGFVTEGARPRVMRSPTRKAEAAMTRLQTIKTGKTIEEKSETASANKDDMLFEILCEIKRNMNASSTIMNELSKKVDTSFDKNNELSRRLDALEARKKKS